MTDESCQPLVSVVIPCYNGEAFLAQAIESALQQTYPRVEILVVDNGSTDRSASIAKSFPVRYLRQREPGLSRARNAGVRESHGEYIVFLDSDDRLRPDGIQIGVSVLQQRPECAMAVGNHSFISDQGEWIAGSDKAHIGEPPYEALLRSNFIEMIASVLFRREALERVGGFDSSLQVAEDYDLYLRIAREYKMVCHERAIGEYRLHRTNASRDSERMLHSTLQVLQRQLPFLKNDEARTRAYMYGVGSWRKQYGRQLAAELGDRNSGRSRNEFCRKLCLLARFYPAGILLLLLRRGLSPSDYARLRGQCNAPQVNNLKLGSLAMPRAARAGAQEPKESLGG